MFPIHKAQASVFNYDEIPAGYYFNAMLEGSGVQRFWHRRKFDAVAAMIDDHAQVLDIGCGPGSFLHVLAENKPGVKAIGVDVASRQIQFASEHVAAKHPGGRISFKVLNSEEPKLPFPDKSFDAVTCIEVIEHIHPFLGMKIVQEARRVLKPGGRLIVTTPNYRSLWPFIELMLEKLSPVKYHEQHISKFTPNALVKFLEAGGFELNRLQTIFVVAPFLASASPPLAAAVHAVERKLDVHVGSLLIADCRLSEV